MSLGVFKAMGIPHPEFNSDEKHVTPPSESDWGELADQPRSVVFTDAGIKPVPVATGLLGELFSEDFARKVRHQIQGILTAQGTDEQSAHGRCDALLQSQAASSTVLNIFESLLSQKTADGVDSILLGTSTPKDSPDGWARDTRAVVERAQRDHWVAVSNRLQHLASSTHAGVSKFAPIVACMVASPVVAQRVSPEGSGDVICATRFLVTHPGVLGHALSMLNSIGQFGDPEKVAGLDLSATTLISSLPRTITPAGEHAHHSLLFPPKETTEVPKKRSKTSKSNPFSELDLKLVPNGDFFACVESFQRGMGDPAWLLRRAEYFGNAGVSHKDLISRLLVASVANLPGETWEGLSKGLAESAGEEKGMAPVLETILEHERELFMGFLSVMAGFLRPSTASSEEALVGGAVGKGARLLGVDQLPSGLVFSGTQLMSTLYKQCFSLYMEQIGATQKTFIEKHNAFVKGNRYSSVARNAMLARAGERTTEEEDIWATLTPVICQLFQIRFI